MNNAVFDKTMENMRNHANVRLVMHWDKRYGVEAMIAKPNFQQKRFFREFGRDRNAETRGEVQQIDIRIIGIDQYHFTKISILAVTNLKLY